MHAGAALHAALCCIRAIGLRHRHATSAQAVRKRHAAAMPRPTSPCMACANLSRGTRRQAVQRVRRNQSLARAVPARRRWRCSWARTGPCPGWGRPGSQGSGTGVGLRVQQAQHAAGSARSRLSMQQAQHAASALSGQPGGPGAASFLAGQSCARRPNSCLRPTLPGCKHPADHGLDRAASSVVLTRSAMSSCPLTGRQSGGVGRQASCPCLPVQGAEWSRGAQPHRMAADSTPLAASKAR